jgi:hypothetical protein
MSPRLEAHAAFRPKKDTPVAQVISSKYVHLSTFLIENDVFCTFTMHLGWTMAQSGCFLTVRSDGAV